MCGNKWIVCVYLGYFMRELSPLGAVVKPQFPMYLTSWMDKTSDSYMYSTNQMRIWSTPHLKKDCWYLECGRIICPIEKEDVKATSNKANLRGVMPVLDVVVVPEELSLADIALLPTKERNRILSQKIRDAEKMERASAKAIALAKKEAKKGEKIGKSKVITSHTKTSSRKKDSTFAELSISRLQLCTLLSFQDCLGRTFLLDELFLSTSLDAIASFYLEHNAFPKEWLKMQGFVQKVFLVFFFSFLHVVTVIVLK